MVDTPSFIRHDAGTFLPFNPNGVLVRDALLDQFGIAWDKRLTITNFAASREGTRAIYAAEARRYSQLTDERGFGIAYGGFSPGRPSLMSACTAHNKYLVGVSPRYFADRKGLNSGLSPQAINIIVDDFYVRKVIMDLLCHRFVVHAGGYGTFEEAVEALIFGAEHGKCVDFLNVDGFWNPFISLLHTLRDIGLLRDGDRNKEGDLGRFTVSPNADIAFAHADRYFRDRPDPIADAGQIIDKRKPNKSLQEFFRQNPHYLPDQLFRFLAPEGHEAPRVGVVVSGNIRQDSSSSRLHDRRLTMEFCEQGERLGCDLAAQGAVLVLAGGRYGLREIMAEAALREGGSVIWIQKDRLTNPIEVSAYGKELTIKVGREFEKAMVFDMISQSSGFMPGGINTLDRVLEIVTREQTGFGRFSYLLDGTPLTALNYPVLGYNIGGLWSDINNQIKRFHEDGFIEDEHRGLFAMLAPKESLAGELVATAKKARQELDILQEIARLPRPAEPGVPGALLPMRSATPG